MKLTREAPKLPGSKAPRQAGSLIRQAMTGALERARFMATLSIAPAGRSASFDVALPVIRRQKAGLGKKAGLLYD